MEDKNTQPPTFEEVVKTTAEPEYGEGPRPDRPFYQGHREYGDPGHFNPAIQDTPPWAPQPERVVVPVINDPGVLGGAPSLADLNRAARADSVERGGVLGPARRTVAVQNNDKAARPDIDDSEGMTEEKNREEIRQAAQARMDKLEEKERAPAADSAHADAEKRREEARARKAERDANK